MNKSVLLGGAAAIVIAAGAYYFTSGGSLPASTTEPVMAEAEADIEASTHAAEATHEASERHINWYDGSVDEAFALAKAENKPIILYWGAVWCPPCAQLKATIFKRHDFIDKTELFVPVYLDGDTDRAQSYGEKFSVRGYPTLIIFNPEGEEVTRLPGGMNLERYADVLDIALNNIRPAKELIAQIMDEGYQPTVQELDLLAHYSWGQDAGLALADHDETEVMNKLSGLTPEGEKEIKSRFEVEYLSSFMSLPGEDEEPFSAEVKEDVFNRTMALLADPEALATNVYFVPYIAADIVSTVTDEESDARAQGTEAFAAALSAQIAAPNLTAGDRLRLYYGEIGLAQLKTGEVSDELKTEIVEAVTAAQAGTDDQYERIVIANTGAGLLMSTDQTEAAQTLLKKELETSETGYYWMLDLASMAEEAGQTDEAIAMFRQAYEGADGNATRLQWGSYYIEGLTSMTGDDVETIESTISGLFGHMAAQSDYMAARNVGGFKRIGRALNAWINAEDATPERAEARDRIIASFDAMCESEVEGEEALTECKEYLQPAES